MLDILQTRKVTTCLDHLVQFAEAQILYLYFFKHFNCLLDTCDVTLENAFTAKVVVKSGSSIPLRMFRVAGLSHHTPELRSFILLLL